MIGDRHTLPEAADFISRNFSPKSQSRKTKNKNKCDKTNRLFVKGV